MRPRLAVFRSNKAIYAQIIDDEKGETLAAAQGKKAKEVGQGLARKAVKKGIKKVKFDRRTYQYHGRVKTLAEGAKEEGLDF